MESWDSLSEKDKELAFHLQNACFAGKEIFDCQKHKYGLWLRRELEAVLLFHEKNIKFQGDELEQWKAFRFFAIAVWHDGVIRRWDGKQRRVPTSKAFVRYLVESSNADLSLVDALFSDLWSDGIFETSSLYEGLTMEEAQSQVEKIDFVDGFRSHLTVLKKKRGELEKFTLFQLYGDAFHAVAIHLRLAITVAGPTQAEEFLALAEFYESADLRHLETYLMCFLRNRDQNHKVELIHGFWKTFWDPLALVGTFCGQVLLRNEKQRDIQAFFNDNASIFESAFPCRDEFKLDAPKRAVEIVESLCRVGDQACISVDVGVPVPYDIAHRFELGVRYFVFQNISYTNFEPTLSASEKEFFLEEYHDHILESRRFKFELNQKLPGFENSVWCQMGIIGKLPRPFTAFPIHHAFSALLEGAMFFAQASILQKESVKELLEVKLSLRLPSRHGEISMLRALFFSVFALPGDVLQNASDLIVEPRNRGLLLAGQYVLLKGLKRKMVSLVCKDGKSFLRIEALEGMQKIADRFVSRCFDIILESDTASAIKLYSKYGEKHNNAWVEEWQARWKALGFGRICNDYLPSVPLVVLKEDASFVVRDFEDHCTYIDFLRENWCVLPRPSAPELFVTTE